MANPCDGVLELMKFHTRVAIVEHELLDLVALIGIDRVQRERAEKLAEFVGVQSFVHCCSPRSTATKRSRILASPARIRLFTVPSGTPRIMATSL